MASPLERVAGFTDPETGRDFPIGRIVEVGRRDGHLYYIVAQRQHDPGEHSMDLHAWITEQVTQTEHLIGENEYPPSQTEGVRLRCESDRQILAIHSAVNDGYSVACNGCGTAGICDDYITENINDCPILLAIGHAHGLTPEILAGLDRPQPPTRTPPEPSPMGRALGEVWGEHLLAGLRTTLPRDVPAALRGLNWKAMP